MNRFRVRISFFYFIPVHSYYFFTFMLPTFATRTCNEFIIVSSFWRQLTVGNIKLVWGAGNKEGEKSEEEL